MHAVFRPSQDGESENSVLLQFADVFLTLQGHFLLVTFLCASKEKLPGRRAEALRFKPDQSRWPSFRSDDELGIRRPATDARD